MHRKITDKIFNISLIYRSARNTEALMPN